MHRVWTHTPPVQKRSVYFTLAIVKIIAILISKDSLKTFYYDYGENNEVSVPVLVT